MKLDLEKLFCGDAAEIPVDCNLVFSDLLYATYCPIKKDVHVFGRAYSKADVNFLELHVDFTFEGFCDRCAEPVERKMEFDVSKILVEDLQNEDDGDDEYVVVENRQIDLYELIREELILFLPSKILCKPDCKGLCPKCGKNLNIEKCDCKKDVDPRMEALLQLLDEE